MNPIPVPFPLGAIEAARARIAGRVLRTPLVRLHVDAPAEIWLKLENLQPIGSFKLRGATNAIAQIPREALHDGVVTASAGNMAQGVAWCARELGVPCRVIVPDHAPRAKTDAVERLGGEIVRRPFADWWNVLMTRDTGGVPGVFIHPVAEPDVIAGNGTIGLEILEDLPDVDAVVVPFGGGGLSCGIAVAMRAHRPVIRVYAVEVETAAPLAASLALGRPASIDYIPSFVDGIGGRTVLEPMWPLVQSVIDASIVMSLAEVAAALRTLVTRAHVVAEGAGAAAVAAALSGKAGSRRVVCVVSGGNIDSAKLAEILIG
ncbi:MAG: pyridoxal-phosphate dependent enzyme [Gemmatimonadaceae bacterium]